ncbi:hypothetical protein GLOIN_2v1526100 [Rhizophagus irregularis DAOM 181602=DAOM 197198]|uniref:Uncharacterized protein n=1 Tax=Rhizophagus irregularis (strain DAOM 181602 / DAOM 197198 / MUCL 43194) TaxID=747089 RepID=A0A2P4QPH4_RHIID|nr:hypothetical protein GLOIN_2v1526100 [Rhizophagus irregularis DAOM 181602=DAOM 197198]POG79522.1 hypothetical protein GLOIN_2v1526100 [Rhizophagus irregularis DAOM 181602=DAOM 197198]|eukprot:XP_025186388.1 hypothetical protein GLOIN_2v1526100 [Rhizophagus irregularis DAOM 181602=DAOM 197198]
MNVLKKLCSFFLTIIIKVRGLSKQRLNGIVRARPIPSHYSAVSRTVSVFFYLETCIHC